MAALVLWTAATLLTACGGALPTPLSGPTPTLVSPAQRMSTATPTPTPSPTQATHWAKVEFNRLVTDAHVLNLLRTNNVMIWRAYMASGDYGRTKGLQGPVALDLLANLSPATHRSVFDVAAFLREAREDSVYTFSQVVSGVMPDYANGSLSWLQFMVQIWFQAYSYS